MSNAIEKDGYLYDPPSWMVCDECGGKGKQYAFSETDKNGRGNGQIVKCPKCAGSPKPGYLPVRYTPEEWKAAGGVLASDMPVWINDESKYGWMYALLDGNKYVPINNTTVIIATSTGKPEEDKSRDVSHFFESDDKWELLDNKSTFAWRKKKKRKDSNTGER